MGQARNEWASEPIAIIGLSCKFAGDATNTDKFWKMLAEGRSGWAEIPSSRFNTKGNYHPNHEKAGTIHVKGAHLIEEDPGLFDAAFFSYSAETASTMDPQFRLQLESVYEALENAGLPLSRIAGSNTSVFAGIFSHDYRETLTRDEMNFPRFLQTGTGSAFASNRLSHFFDFQGASMTVDTGCSTALVALHQAVQSLRSGEADMSVVGGSNLMLAPDMFMGLGSVGFLSPDGKSYAFDARANGYGRGEGVATLVIKRLSDALAAGDAVRAVIRETCLNQDGKSETITSPSQVAQEALMRDCYRRAGLDPRKTQYFEAHGTGTPMGDPIETGAVATVFRHGRSKEDALLIGSVKTNIGHTETTSGLAAVIKCVLAMEKGMIPPSINFETPNSKIKFDEWRLRVVTKLEQWPRGAPGEIRRASINNFGYGGTNSHVILDDAQSWVPNTGGTTKVNGTNGYVNGQANGHAPLPVVYSTAGIQSKVLMFSARDEQACERMVSNLKEYLEQKRETPEIESQKLLERIVYTLGERRTVFPWVAVHPVPCTSGLDGLIEALDLPGFRATRTSRSPRIGLVFTGQGAQWHAMGRELVGAYPVFKIVIEEAEGHLRELGANWSLLEELSRDANTSRVNDTGLSIPICVALQIALVHLLRSWGVTPSAVTAHSSGEISAAYTVGAISLRQAMAISYYRAALTADKSLRGPVQGGMLAVGLGEAEAQDYLDRIGDDNGKAVVACVNSPASVTIAGDVTAIQKVEDMVQADGVFARRLRVDTGYHSHHMSPVAAPYLKALRALPPDMTGESMLDKIAFSSAVTGDRISDAVEIADPRHWVGSLVQPVQFVDAFADMVLGDMDPTGSSIDMVIEVGPHSALGGPIKEILSQLEYEGLQIPYYSCLVRNTNAHDSVQLLAANLIREGLTIDMAAVNFPHGKASHISVVTDLPSYPWNHKNKHWVEPRFAQAVRTRDRPHHDLLGLYMPGANPDAPVWRNVVRVTDLPWLRDHVVQGNILYPGAGFVCLAIEAMKQQAEFSDKMSDISGYRLRDVDILQALVVPDTAEGIEIQTCLRQAGDKIMATSGWMHFSVFSVTSDNRWTQHAQGLISYELASSPSAVDPKGISRDMIASMAGIAHMRGINPGDMFATLRSLGISHGPKFQNISDIVQAGRVPRSVAQMSVPDTSAANDLPREHLIHPTTLDSVVTAVYSALPGAGEREDSAKVPRSIERLWISSGIHHEPGTRLKSFSVLTHNDSQGLNADVCVVDGAKLAHQKHDPDVPPLITIQGFRYQSLGRGAVGKEAKPWEKEMFSKIEWAPDLSLGLPSTLEAVRKQLSRPEDVIESGILLDLRRVCVYFMQDALATLTSADIAQLEPHHVKFHRWMQDQLQLAREGRLGPESASWMNDDAEERKKRVALAATQSTDGELVCRLGPHLVEVLRRERSPLELMMQDKLLYKYYGDGIKSERCQGQFAALLRAVVHKNPRSRVLEIGAGTGSATRAMLKELGTPEEGGPLVESWHFTDVSSGFFEAARTEFAAWGDILEFDRLDIEQDPAMQGFKLGSYDIVVACEVLHATKNMKQTMAYVRSLMKPGAKLLLMEWTQDQLDVQFSFGLLPGWWLSEEPERRNTPSLSLELWDEILKGAGFTGVDVRIRDCESDDMYSVSTIMSTVAPLYAPKLASEDMVIIISSKAPPATPWLDALQASIARIAGGPPPVVQTLEDSAGTTYNDKVCIFAGEVGKSILHGLDNESLGGIKNMVTSCKGLLWLTRGGAVGCEDPEQSLAPGFLRSLRNEYVGRRFMTMDLDPQALLWSTVSVSSIVQVLIAGFDSTNDFYLADDNTPEEFEYAEREGIVLVARLFKDVDRNKAVKPDAVDFGAVDDISKEPFFQADRPLCMQVGIPGLLDTVAFGDDEWAAAHLEGPFPPDMIEIAPAAYGVNFRDVMVAMGQLRERIMGMECAGVITRVGSEAAAQGFTVGNRVMAMLLGPFSSRARIVWHGVTHMPSGLTFDEAASLPVIFATAYMSLVEIAHLEAGQSVLIHAAAGGVGQAAVMLAKHLGAEVYATVGSQEKRELIMNRYGIPASRIFNSRDMSFAQGILAATGGRGVDVVLNSLAGPLLQASFDILARFGHFVEIGKRDLEGNSALEMETFSRHTSFSVVDLVQMLRHRGPRMNRTLREVARLFEQGAVAPVHPITAYPMADVAKAFRLLQTGKHLGKIVLSLGPEERVPVLPRISRTQLASDASYLIVGGLGGLGRSVAHWMVDHGARNLILLSRSSGTVEKSKAFIAELEEAGCSVKAVGCDVTDGNNLTTTLDACEKEGLPPVRGVIQAAMVIQDSVLEHMTIAHWNASLPPKVRGTWNLHTQFSQPGSLDFFIILSSLIGIVGLASQANYSAGGAYEDALARWRVAQGLPAVSVDLGGIKGVGHVQETAGVAARLVQGGHWLLSEKQVLDAVETAIRQPTTPQVVTAVNAGPGHHWDCHGESQMGRDARFLPLKYRQVKAQAGGDKKAGSLVVASLAERLAEASSHEDAAHLVGKSIATKLAGIFMIALADIDLAKPPSHYGVDSLVAVELRNMLVLQAAAEVSIFNILQSPSLAALAVDVVAKSGHVQLKA
ncbi:hypothetical protein F5Y12DRAFT_790457 [Xylaria sp. FL1777]|nr:hypothetical protein F5Y12DRAFT_790457 [Xylaria sp. FL1777]